MAEDKSEEGGVTRLSFIKASAVVAAGTAAVGVPAAAALSGEGGHEIPTPASPAPREPVVAYVHDAGRGEVTVMSGSNQVTYRDRALAKRLMDAAPQGSVTDGGGIDVVAP
jgi:hypothetical protein